MSEMIHVRLVPKTRQAESIVEDLREITPRVAKRFSPDPARAADALRSCSRLGMRSRVTPHHSVDMIVARNKIQQVFKTKIVDEKKLKRTTRRSIGKEKFATPATELQVPDEMKDTIAFAYIPTPPQFFASFVPPIVSHYHLRLGDVLAAFNGGQCHRKGWTGRGIKVAMTDTGFANHPYFSVHGYNITRLATSATEHPLIDTSGHGTGESANVLILAPDCSFVGVKHDDYSAMALETALDQNPKIITNSWGWDIDEQSKEDLKAADPNLFNELRDVENIISDAVDDGVVMIFSAGNGHHAFPGSFPYVISAGGVTVYEDGTLSASSYASSFQSQLYPGRQVPDFCGIVGEYSTAQYLKGHIMLPVPDGSELEGENMPASQDNKGWGVFSGTSAAAPQIAGTAALMLSANPNLTPLQVKSILSGTARDVTAGSSGLGDSASAGPDAATGAGFIDAYQACLLAEQSVS